MFFVIRNSVFHMRLDTNAPHNSFLCFQNWWVKMHIRYNILAMSFTYYTILNKFLIYFIQIKKNLSEDPWSFETTTRCISIESQLMSNTL